MEVNVDVVFKHELCTGVTPETFIERQVMWHDCLLSLLGDEGSRSEIFRTRLTWSAMAWQKSLVKSQQARRTNQVEGPLSYVLLESPFSLSFNSQQGSILSSLSGSHPERWHEYWLPYSNGWPSIPCVIWMTAIVPVQLPNSCNSSGITVNSRPLLEQPERNFFQAFRLHSLYPQNKLGTG